jgi:hypothetical protein
LRVLYTRRHRGVAMGFARPTNTGPSWVVSCRVDTHGLHGPLAVPGHAWLNGLCHAWPVRLEAKPEDGPDRPLCWHDPLKIMLVSARAMLTRLCFVLTHLSMARMTKLSFTKLLYPSYIYEKCKK